MLSALIRDTIEIKIEPQFFQLGKLRDTVANALSSYLCQVIEIEINLQGMQVA